MTMLRITLLAISVLLLTACGVGKTARKTKAIPTNVLIVKGDKESPYGPCEPSIAINPKDPKIILAGSILNRVHRSADGGKTWQTTELTSPFGVFGDPVIHADAQGNFYYAHLSDPEKKGWASMKLLDRIVIDKSTDGGATFVSSFTGLNHPKDQDKHWLNSDPRTGQLYCTWTEFDLYGSKVADNRSRIKFSTSTDFGDSWSDAIAISEKEGDCLDDDLTTEGAVPCVGPKGEVYVAWAYGNKIYFDRSLDQGKTWLAKDITVADQPGGWTIDIPGVGRCNGMPVTDCDLSNGPHNGTLYVNWADQRKGGSDTDIWVARSTDRGSTWSAPIRVNQDKTATQQFFSWMTIDQTTGYVYVVYYDRSRYGTTNATDVVLATSKDGGRTWTDRCISETPFTPSEGTFFGDYNHISAYGGSIRPIWTRLEEGVLSVWTALVEEVK
jgi:hypothetical protein